MSKIGKINISIPEKVKVALAGNILNIEGPLGKKSIGIDLEIFNLDIKLISGFNEPFELISQDWNHLHKIETELIERSLTSNSDNIYIDGYWQSPKYFGNTSEYFKNFKYIIPQGSVMSQLGNYDMIGSLSNCFVAASS